VEYPNLTYHVPPQETKRKKRQPPPRRHSQTAADSLFDFEPQKTRVAEFWDLYHELPEEPEAPEVTQMKADLRSYANEHGYSVKTNLDLNKTIRGFIQFEGCPWSPWAKEMCPCSRFKEDGKCKKGMLIKIEGQ